MNDQEPCDLSRGRFRFDLCDGCIQAIIVPERMKFCGIFGSDCEYVIPFECIKKVGSDIIMVEISEEKCLKGCKE